MSCLREVRALSHLARVGVLLLVVSVASVRMCEGIPRPFARVVPNIISSSALTSVGVQILGLCHGQAPLQSLQAYRTGTGGVFGGTGAGDWIFSLAPAVIVALGFTSLSLTLSLTHSLSLSISMCVCARVCVCLRKCAECDDYTHIRFRLFEQRMLLLRHFAPLVGGQLFPSVSMYACMHA